MIPSVSDLQVGCLDGGKQLLVRVSVHGQVDSAFVELRGGDATDAAMLDRVIGVPLVDHGQVVFNPDYTIRYAIIPLDETSALRCDHLDRITASAVVTMSDGSHRIDRSGL
jgi:hypothetical protein